MRKAATVKRSRVILGATCYADAEAALNVAVAVAQQINAELHGLLVSDEAILTAVEGPHSLTVSYSGASVAIENAEAMHRAFLADAAHFQKRLLERAGQASLGHAFSQISGRMPVAATEMASRGDLIVYGFRRPRGSEEGLVLLLDGDVQNSLIELAGRLAAALGQPLIVFARQDQADEAGQALRDTGLQDAQLRLIADDQALLSDLGRMRPAAVLLASEASGKRSIERIVEAARCPVIVPAG